MAPSLSGIVASEAGSVEKPALALLAELGSSLLNLQDEAPGPQNPTGRKNFREAYLPARLRAALAKLNPNLPASVHPRVCVERPIWAPFYTTSTGSSPRVRGTLLLDRDQAYKIRFIPACAGNATPEPPAPPTTAVHPRVCGERSRHWIF